MKQKLVITLLILVSSILAHAQSPPPAVAVETDAQRAAKEELRKAALAYVGGKWVESQRHAEKMLEVEPSNVTATFFFGASTPYAIQSGRSKSRECNNRA